MGENKILSEAAWWQKGVIYQIYPLSFQDSNGDGKGDLLGLEQRLDYLKDLEVDAVWLSPIYPSPMKDFGYDVSDYTDVDPTFGTLADFDRIVREIHARDMKILLDFVPNHTSDEHPWFLESRSSRRNRKRDWYIWKDPSPEGGPPNNWLSNFGGPAWTFDDHTQQYYYHAFLKHQPDLNWRNPELREAMYANMRFWLDRGVDGFRVDVIWHIIKDDQFRDNPDNPDYLPSQSPHDRLIAAYNSDRPEVHDIISEMRSVLNGYPDRMMVGEIYLPIPRLVAYYGAGNSGVHLPFNFHLMDVPWCAHNLRAVIRDYLGSLPTNGWPNWVLGNHDKPRLASRIGDVGARMAAVLLLTLKGTPTLYYGDEIGMHTAPLRTEDIQDPLEKNVPGLGLGRDGARTPMQWDSSDFAGFSSADTWLPVNPQSKIVNVQKERDDPGSLLNLYRKLLHLRRREPALSIGDFEELKTPSDDLLMYSRRLDEFDSFIVILNFSEAKSSVHVPDGEWHGLVEISTHPHHKPGEKITGDLLLEPHEALVLRGPTSPLDPIQTIP
jgi:alpha-glucosidase